MSSRAQKPALVWFRDDLRTGDHPALAAAIARGAPVAGLYVLEEEGPRPLGAAARWKLHGALAALERDLAALNVPLILKCGSARTILPETGRRLGAEAAFWNRRYEPAAVSVDRAVKSNLKSLGIEARSFSGTLLVEPFAVRTKAGGDFKTFTPFCEAARALGAPEPLSGPGPAAKWTRDVDCGARLESWSLRPTRPDWADGLRATWGHGEAAATSRLAVFLEDGFEGYRNGRDILAGGHVSGLSPHLRFGEISARQARMAALVRHGETADFEAFERELYWRDFSYNLLHHADDLASKNVQTRFDAFPWANDEAAAEAWRRGRTGYPVVDAAMRELWRTGYVHNRARMIVASFLTKHLRIDWRVGEAWFWDTLVDADVASNPANWQWVAGSGADAAPYFRIFNPMTQGEKFDPDGAYVGKWVPELAGMPAKHIHAPWSASEGVLLAARVALGETYPRPIVDHAEARKRALAAFEATKG